MDAQRWQRFDQIFQTALEQEPGERAAYLDEACSGDWTLRSEVEVMLAADERGWGLLERNAFEVAAGLLAEDHTELSEGETVGHYRVLGLLGAGGMGQVYLAEDTRLGRKVALKLLPAGYTKDESRLRRFWQEARSASALNHPNIIIIYDIWEIEGRHLIATEYIEGETLRQRIRRENLSTEAVLDISIQVASALSEAHQAGIVHLDVKPENTMLRRDGYVKVVDFGLAKLTELESSGPDGSRADLGAAGSTPAPLIGTVKYMSPEQAGGLSLDARSDIFSLGVVIYEMLAGRPPFAGETPGRVIAAILRQEPPALAAARPEIPAELDRIVSKALQKDREKRYQTLQDLLTDLRNLCRDLGFHHLEGRLAQGTPSGLKHTTAAARARRWLTGLAAAALLIGTAAGITWWIRRPAAAPRPYRLSKLVAYSSYNADPAVSPDGKYFAFASNRAGEGNTDIWMQPVSGGESVRLTDDPADELTPDFSPDGTKIAFCMVGRGRNGIFVVSTQGGEPYQVAPPGDRPRWSPDGKWLAYWTGLATGAYGPDSGPKIFLVPAEGGEPRQFRPDFLTVSRPAWSPDGKYLLFVGMRDREQKLNDWWVAPVEGGEAVKTGTMDIFLRHKLSAPPARWLPDNHILFTSGTGSDGVDVWRIPLTPGTWQTQDKPERLTSLTGMANSPAPLPDGRFLFNDLKSRSQLWSLPLAADKGKVIGEPLQLTNDEGYNFYADISTDGNILLYVSTRTGRSIVWHKNFMTGKDTRLGLPDEGFDAILSPSGRMVAFVMDEGQNPGERIGGLYSIPLSGGAAERLTQVHELVPWSWLYTQDKVLFGAGERGAQNQQIFLFDVQTKNQQLVLEHKEYRLVEVFPSPDDRWVAFAATGKGRTRVYLAPLHPDRVTPESEWVGVTEWGKYETRPRWSPNGTLLYFVSGRDNFSCVWAQRIDPTGHLPDGEAVPVHHFHNKQIRLVGIALARDKLVYNLDENVVSIWLAEP